MAIGVEMEMAIFLVLIWQTSSLMKTAESM